MILRFSKFIFLSLSFFLSFFLGVRYFEVKFMLMEDKMLTHTPKIIGFVPRGNCES